MTQGITTRSTAEWQALDAAHHLHPFTDTGSLNRQGVRVITRAKGIHIWDSEGNRLIDGMSGLWNVNVGHGRDEIVDAIADQLRTLDFYNTFFKTTHPPATELAAVLAEIAPPGFSRVFYAGSGSEANDTIIRLVRHFWAIQGQPEKTVFISRKNAYHGSTMGGASLGGMKFMHEQGGLPIPGIVHVAQPYWWGEGGQMSPEEFGLWAANQVAEEIDRIGAPNVAAFIGEPIQGAGGVIVPPATYWPAVQRICRERDVLLVSDEVICGFGRTGHWFGCEHFGMQPDLMTIAKGVTSGYFPLGGVLVGDRVAEVITSHPDDFNHGYTYSGHPGACAAALANLALIRREKLVERVRDDVGPYLQQRWTALADHPLVGEARMVGLIGALELTPDKHARARFPGDGKAGTICRNISFREGLVMRATGDTMMLAPPLVVTHDEIDEIVAIAHRVLDLTEAELKRQGLLS
jgi:putrescine aminotransferase